MIWVGGGGAGGGAGRLVEEAQARVSVFDHGLTVGDGVFETVKADHGSPFALSRHLRRLARSAEGLGLGSPDLDDIRRGVHAVLDAGPPLERARVRITVTAGLAPLGSERTPGEPTFVVAAADAGPWQSYADVAVVPWTRNERGALTGLKTTSYAENVRALAYAKERGANEAVFANTAGRLCEGTGSNVFAVLDGRLLTPPLSSGCLAGITRELVLEWFGGEEADLEPEVLTTASEVFLTSTVRDVQPVRSVDGAALRPAPGSVTQAVMESFAKHSADLRDP
ncbi:aminotransferase class IV [Allonocardiopsis opalescens]|uniref:Branched-chain amino acid aminotransferase n=1 Tax=Allonocardiopsis opalescens TaxID=1144618 RepID=A0A2T0PX23_9ACTN|nr:aminotransferase class IV [Allonocardiopsis opalescens]PRX96084.1 branched-chain amino acid aminotransferase [Allonocardiopsis opalescens]